MRNSRDFFKDEEENIDILEEQNTFDFDKNNPIPNIMVPNYKADKSEASALGFGDDEFNYDMDAEDIIERNDLSADIEPSFRYGDISHIKYSDNDNLNHSGILNKSGLSNKLMVQGSRYYNNFEIIEEGNDEYTSSNRVSLDGSKGPSSTIPTPRREEESKEESKDEIVQTGEDNNSDNSSDSTSPFRHLDRIDSPDKKDLRGFTGKFSFHMNAIEKKQDITLDLDSNTGSNRGSTNNFRIPSLKNAINALNGDKFENSSSIRGSIPDFNELTLTESFSARVRIIYNKYRFFLKMKELMQKFLKEVEHMN